MNIESIKYMKAIRLQTFSAWFSHPSHYLPLAILFVTQYL